MRPSGVQILTRTMSSLSTRSCTVRSSSASAAGPAGQRRVGETGLHDPAAGERCQPAGVVHRLPLGEIAEHEAAHHDEGGECDQAGDGEAQDRPAHRRPAIGRAHRGRSYAQTPTLGAPRGGCHDHRRAEPWASRGDPPVTDWAVDVITTLGYIGLAGLMLVECVFPPIPSEAILPFAGFAVYDGEMTFPLALAAATAGSLVGNLALYVAARRGGLAVVARHGHRVGATPGAARAHGGLDGPVGRGDRARGARDPARADDGLLPAGLACFPFWRFVVLTTLGSPARNGVLIGLGLAPGRIVAGRGEGARPGRAWPWSWFSPAEPRCCCAPSPTGDAGSATAPGAEGVPLLRRGPLVRATVGILPTTRSRSSSSRSSAVARARGWRPARDPARPGGARPPSRRGDRGRRRARQALRRRDGSRPRPRGRRGGGPARVGVGISHRGGPPRGQPPAGSSSCWSGPRAVRCRASVPRRPR